MNVTRNKVYTKTWAGRNRGAALMTTVLFMLAISIVIMVGSSSPALRDLNNARTLIVSKTSYYTSEAGMEDAIYRYKQGKQISNPEYTYLNNGYSRVATTPISATEKQIVALGNVSTDARKVQVNLITGVGSTMTRAAHIGPGGLVMASNSKITGKNGAPGDVFSNGPIIGNSGWPASEIKGNATAAFGVEEDTSASSATYNADQFVSQASAQADAAQSFTPSKNLPLPRVSLYLKRVQVPTSPTVKIIEDNAGNPTGAMLASAVINTSDIGFDYGWINVNFSTPPNLVAGRTYWIVLDTSFIDSARYFVWGKDATGGYANGSAKYASTLSGPWTAITGDLMFKTYLGVTSGLIYSMHVTGDAYAHDIQYGTIDGVPYCQTGFVITCNTTRPDPAPLPMPLSDANLQQFKSDATAGGVITGNCGDSGAAECRASGTTPLSIGPKKIVGNLTLTGGHVFNLTGVLYVTGNVNVSGSGKIKCDASFNADTCVLITDGYINMGVGALFEGSQPTGSFYIMGISTLRGCNGTASTGCTTNNSAINLAEKMPQGIFYTTDSMVNLTANGEVAEVTAYKVNIAGGTEIEYQIGVATTVFSPGVTNSWNVKTWKEVQ